MAQYDILQFLKKRPGELFSSSELVIYFDITHKNISKQLNKLVQWGYIEKCFIDTSNKPFYRYRGEGSNERQEKEILLTR